MKITVKRTSDVPGGIPGLVSRLRPAQVAGLTAGANVIRNAVVKPLRPGGKGYVFKTSIGNPGPGGSHRAANGRFLSNHFYTGTSAQHVTISEPIITGATLAIRVGTDLRYNLCWELGHHNLFTRHFERDEKWVPAFRESRHAAATAYERAFKRAWLGSGAR